jgi:hypothetical protein
MLDVLGRASLEHAGLGALEPLLLDAIERGALQAHDVEPSVALGDPAYRLGVNPSSLFDRPEVSSELTSALLRVLGVVEPLVHGEVARWLLDPRRELFVAFALEARPRVKLYLRDPRSPDALALAGSRLLGRGLSIDGAHTLCVDFVDGVPRGGKRYRHGESSELRRRAPRLAAFLDAHGVDCALVAAQWSERLEGGGSVVHAQVAGFARPELDLGVAYARALGAREVDTLAAWCAAVPLFTRVIGTALESAAHTVYLGMPSTTGEPPFGPTPAPSPAA